MRVLSLPLALLLFAAACHSGNNQNEFLASADSTAFAGDVSSITSSSRKIVKKADLRCRVTNIYDAISGIEHAARSAGGMVALSELQNTFTQQKVLAYKPDSLRQVNIYSPSAHLQLRIPSAYVDTVLDALPAIVDFIEYRKLRQDDHTLAYLANALKNKAHTQAAGKAAQADTTAKGDLVVNRRIDNLRILDEVNYTTVTIELVQPAQVYSTVIVNPDYAAKEPFATRLTGSMAKGWALLTELIVALVTIWPLWLAGAVIWQVIRTTKRKNRLRPGKLPA